MAANEFPSGQRLLSVDAAAIYIGRTPWAVRELIWKGRLPAVRPDRRVQLDIRDLDRFIEENKTRESNDSGGLT